MAASSSVLRGSPPKLKCASCGRLCRGVNIYGDCLQCQRGVPFDHAKVHGDIDELAEARWGVSRQLSKLSNLSEMSGVPVLEQTLTP